MRGGLQGMLAAAGLAAAIAASATAPTSSALAPAAPRLLSAVQIVERNVAARGGAEAWRQVQTMEWSGRLRAGSGSAQATAMPFKMALKRPNKTRFEILSMDQRFLRVFDGTQGWKLRPGPAGPDVRAFSDDDVRFAQDEFAIDGLLIEHRAKGIEVTLEGINEIEGRKAYRLGLKLPSGASRRLWVDAETFLEVRCDRPSWNAFQRGAAVSVIYRDYRNVDGLQIPTTIETGPAVEGAPTAPRDRLTIERVQVNPPLQDMVFAKPATPHPRRAMVPLGIAPTGATAAAPGR